MLELIRKIVFQVTGKDTITYDTDFVQDLRLNSFEIMNIVSAFEEYFDTTIPNRDVWQLHQVKDVIAYMQEKGISASEISEQTQVPEEKLHPDYKEPLLAEEFLELCVFLQLSPEAIAKTIRK